LDHYNKGRGAWSSVHGRRRFSALAQMCALDFQCGMSGWDGLKLLVIDGVDTIVVEPRKGQTPAEHNLPSWWSELFTPIRGSRAVGFERLGLVDEERAEPTLPG